MTGDTIEVCPECDSPERFSKVSGSHVGAPAEGDPGWKCYRCGAEFDEPKERERRSQGPSAEAILEQVTNDGD